MMHQNPAASRHDFWWTFTAFSIQFSEEISKVTIVTIVTKVTKVTRQESDHLIVLVVLLEHSSQLALKH